jgi:hypothetical protein
MREELLTQYMEAGLPHFRQLSGLPEWLVPDVAEVARTLGDETMLEIAEPLGIAEKVKTLLDQAPEPGSLPVEIWQDGIHRWQAINQVLPVTIALLRAREKVDTLERRGVLKVDFASLVRGLATISYAPFVPDGSEILSRLAAILGGSSAEPAGLLHLYTLALVKGDEDTLADIDNCILQNPAWAAWSERFLTTGKAFPSIPRVIGVSTPLTSELAQVLVTMIMEVLNANSGGNYPN